MLKIIKVIVGLFIVAAHFTVLSESRAVSSLGRIEPYEGVIQVAGPSSGGASGSVIKSLTVKEGDWVEKGQVIAYLDNYSLREAEVARLQAIYTNARSELNRQQNLSLTSLEILEPNLESVFLHLTGKKLRE